MINVHAFLKQVEDKALRYSGPDLTSYKTVLASVAAALFSFNAMTKADEALKTSRGYQNWAGSQKWNEGSPSALDCLILKLAEKNVEMDALLKTKATHYDLCGKVVVLGSVLLAGGMYGSIRWMKTASIGVLGLSAMGLSSLLFFHRGDRKRIEALCGEINDLCEKIKTSLPESLSSTRSEN